MRHCTSDHGYIGSMQMPPMDYDPYFEPGPPAHWGLEDVVTFAVVSCMWGILYELSKRRWWRKLEKMMPATVQVLVFFATIIASTVLTIQVKELLDVWVALLFYSGIWIGLWLLRKREREEQSDLDARERWLLGQKSSGELESRIVDRELQRLRDYRARRFS